MTDFRIAAGREGSAEPPKGALLVEVLINRAEDIAGRFELVASNLPYRAANSDLRKDGISELTKALATATWKRVSDEVPNYAFAEALGRDYREAGASLAALLLHWQILRRAIHLVLADRKIRTGEGGESLLRQMTLMNYTIDWATEASVVGYVMARGSDD